MLPFISPPSTISPTLIASGNLHHNHEIPGKEMPLDGMGTDVGLLREQWTLPSDRLPIGVTFPGNEPMSDSPAASSYLSQRTVG